MQKTQLPVQLIPVPPPPADQQVRRQARLPVDGEKPNRYHLPRKLSSSSPVGYRTRIPITAEEATQAAALLSMSAQTSFAKTDTGPTEGELFDEVSLGVLSSRQSTNFRGYRQITFGPADSARIATLLARLQGREGEVLDHGHEVVRERREHRQEHKRLDEVDVEPRVPMGTRVF